MRIVWLCHYFAPEIGAPQERECLPSNRSHLVQNVAAAAKRTVLFTHGLGKKDETGESMFVKPPRGHRRRQRPRLSDA